MKFDLKVGVAAQKFIVGRYGCGEGNIVVVGDVSLCAATGRGKDSG